MIQQQVKMPAGSFSLCRCGSEPRYIQIRGRSKLETGTATPSVRHMLECRCGHATAKHASLTDAVAEWGPLLSQRPLALPAPVVRLPRRGVRKEVRRG